MSAPFSLRTLALTLALTFCVQGISNAAPPNQLAADEKVTLNFVDAEIDTVIKALGLFTQKNFVIDGRVKGKINLVSPRPLNREEALSTLLSALRLQGISVVEADGVAKVLPEADAKLHGGSIRGQGDMNGRGDQVITRVFQLRMESANNLLPVLRPLISPNNSITAYPANNTLVITDYAENINRLARIIASVDNSKISDVKVLPVQHAVASDMAALLSKSLDEGGGTAADPGQRISIMADSRSNRLIIRSSSPGRVALATRLLEELDQPSSQPGNIHIVYLKNAEASKLAGILRSVISGDSGASGASASSSLAPGNSAFQSGNNTTGNGNGSGFASASGNGNTTNNGSLNSVSNNSTGGGMIQADPSTNSLIITAPEPVYRNLRSIIDKLDMRRAQVFVESLIVEVSAENVAEFGIQWQGVSNSTNVFGGTNFTTPGSGSNILTLGNSGASGALPTPGGGLNFGLINGTALSIGGVTIGNLGLLARALETTGKANILSTPNLMTLDNEEARIIIGQNVPFVTGQYASTGNTATVNPFQTVERKDVGLTLKVKPQVSDGGIVRMQIYQETSNVASTTSTNLITTNKRAIETTVLVDDGQIIALGGLIEDSEKGSVEMVPFLGNIPFIGALFRYDNRKRSKTNLMVFLRPYVVRTPEDSRGLVTDRYDYMRSKNIDNLPEKRLTMPEFGAPLLPPLESGVTARDPFPLMRMHRDLPVFPEEK
ncbi:MAG: type II secretion system secretin GspD [Dechloromonas sp.]|uniref:Type II secretion system secretin GspD n=1 Tax=Candidatus Dechloromonas phosphorivorans TaxID=2899244 RepID=A0A935MXB4_9RHOO|nr:type II secretion system secretin GspD [Candidatus Dechloromonas phosphorivorans]